MSGEIRFGPDVEWLDPPKDETGWDEMDFWDGNLAVNEDRLRDSVAEVRKFLPGVRADGFSPDCERTTVPAL